MQLVATEGFKTRLTWTKNVLKFLLCIAWEQKQEKNNVMEARGWLRSRDMVAWLDDVSGDERWTNLRHILRSCTWKVRKRNRSRPQVSDFSKWVYSRTSYKTEKSCWKGNPWRVSRYENQSISFQIMLHLSCLWNIQGKSAYKRYFYVKLCRRSLRWRYTFESGAGKRMGMGKLT